MVITFYFRCKLSVFMFYLDDRFNWTEYLTKIFKVKSVEKSWSVRGFKVHTRDFQTRMFLLKIINEPLKFPDWSPNRMNTFEQRNWYKKIRYIHGDNPAVIRREKHINLKEYGLIISCWCEPVRDHKNNTGCFSCIPWMNEHLIPDDLSSPIISYYLSLLHSNNISVQILIL